MQVRNAESQNNFMLAINSDELFVVETDCECE